jgi:geranylgeranyl diphosphate synthase type II
MIEQGDEPYARLIERELLASVPKDGPQAHLYELVGDYPARGGKRLRPMLCLAACGAAGGRPKDALDAAIALELLHNAFLVHDDIVDASHRRRGAPTLHALVGMPLALNAGDGLFALALERVAVAAAQHPKFARTILAEFAHMLRRTVEGQAVELGWSAEDRWDITDEQYLAMVRDKTAWYSFIHPLRLGTLLGGGQIDANAFVDLGCLLGAVFQIHDDLDNLLADPSNYDKDLGCDLVEAKRTLPVLHVLRHGSGEQIDCVRRHLGRDSNLDGAGRLAAVLPTLEQSGSIAHAQSVADTFAATASRQFRSTFAQCPPSDGLLRLIAMLEALLFERAATHA